MVAILLGGLYRRRADQEAGARRSELLGQAAENLRIARQRASEPRRRALAERIAALEEMK